MLITDLTLGTFNNPYLAGKKPFSAELFGDYDFTRAPYVDFGTIKNNEPKEEQLSPYQQFIVKAYKDAQDEKKYYRSDEYLDKMYKRADDLQAKQMARAQKYGKESAFYGFMYQGLPKLMAQAAFSRYAFAPEMVKGIQDAYSRIDLAGAAKPSGRQTYMTVNPMGGIG